ncbi:hypothetical protein BZB76_1617 [Actinomadura pelletieri DSM 43383]|uniref:Uncharacterized protein n=1 Tax=Actinomadura pelletieri DSM 43383 TaxID=1120940 RepID=A0A495QRZ6_9ACTN|nr:hypothetical protein [Actinomadura pelletieri]RKS76266.1 hypothetical protein BZB76_1617 [Actinomadura pelletieri DSM 43383]
MREICFVGAPVGTYRRRVKLLSVNIGKPRANPWKVAAVTGIETFCRTC